MRNPPRSLRPLAVAAVLTAAAPLAAQCASAWQRGALPGCNGAVRASTMWDPDGQGPLAPRLVVGGSFTQVDTQSCRSIASHDLATAAWTPLGAGIDGSVEALATLPNGDLVAAGDFAAAGGVPCRRIARWDGAAWHPLGGGFDAAVHALHVLANGDVVAGGAFRDAGGTTADYVARWDGTSWSPMPGLNGIVWSLTQLANGDVVAGGWITTAGGSPASRIARWNGTGWSEFGGGVDGEVRALTALPNGDLLVGGRFTTAGGIPANRIARWSGAGWSALGAGTDDVVHVIRVLGNGDVVAGGGFAAAGVAAARIARWDGAAWHPFGSGVGISSVPTNDPVHTVTVLPGGELFAGGDFTWANAAVDYLALDHMARWTGTEWRGLGTGFDYVVEGLLPLDSGETVAVGGFATVGGATCSGLAIRIDGTWRPFAPSAAFGAVSAIVAMPDGTLVANTRTVTAPYQYVLRRWDGVSWSPLAFPGSIPTALRVEPNGDLIVGDRDRRVWIRSGTTWTQLPQLAGWLSTIGIAALVRLPNGELVAGGAFQVNGTYGIARWDGVAWRPFGAGVNGTVRDLLLRDNGDLVAGGVFTTSTGARNIARWDGAQWQPMGDLVSLASSYEYVRTLLALPDGDVVAAGKFEVAGTSFVNNIARWDGSRWSPMGFGLGTPYTTNQVYALALDAAGTLFAGGMFAASGSLPTPYLATYATSCPATATPIATPCVGPTGPLGLGPDSLPWIGGEFGATATGFAPGALGVALVGFQSPGSPLSNLFATALPGCDLLATPDATVLVVPGAGAAAYSFAVPNDLLLVNLPLYHQFLQLDVGAGGQLTSVSSSNGLRLVLGVL